MKINDIWGSLLSKRTWIRVDEITRWGYFKNKEKAVLFRRPVAREDVLPMAISNILIVLMILIIMLIALNIFSLLINVLLCIVLLVLIFLPAYLARVYFKDKDSEH
jgi:hypothetical protein